MATVTAAHVSQAFERATEPAPLVEVPIEVHVPSERVYIAASTNNWTHLLLTVTGNVARGTITAKRGEWIDYKIARVVGQRRKLADCSDS